MSTTADAAESRLSAEYHDEKDGSLHRSSSESYSSASAEELRKEYGDLEAQKQPNRPAEQQVSYRKKLLFLAVYFVLNLALTLSNKAVLGKVRLSTIYHPCLS